MTNHGRISVHEKTSSGTWGLLIMRSRRWGLIAAVALVMAAVLLGITLIWQRGPEATVSATLTTTRRIYATPSSSPVAAATSTKPVTYTVQGGDTLSAIAQEHDVSLEALATANDLADPDVLQVGQILIIPRDDGEALPGPTATETSAPDSSTVQESLMIPPTMTPSGPPLVEISEVAGAGDLQAEVVVLSNEGGTVSLETWTLVSPTDDRFMFPALTLFPESEVRVHSIEGENTPRDLYWGRTESVWQEGELVTLRDGDGNVVDTYIVPE